MITDYSKYVLCGCFEKFIYLSASHHILTMPIEKKIVQTTFNEQIKNVIFLIND